MALAPGTHLGSYEILAPLGAGGMGEVYRARDARLGRDVAIKILPASVAADPDLRQRFEREARALAALSHPHICAVYDVGRQDDLEFLVMECLEGETLADRLVKGPLSLDQALRYAVQIADALDKAHRKGVIHRDLKPANIMLTKSGAKLLDFGLAKNAPPAAGAPGGSMLPTTPRGLTVQGTILGTFQYMAPEQLEGADADARTDIFAFGAVLYEMLTGRKAFDGKSQASLIAAILEREPQPLREVAPLTPPLLDNAVRRCLAKDPDNRWQSAADLSAQLDWLQGAGAHPSDARVAERPRRPRWLPVAVTAAVLIALASVAARLVAPTPVQPDRIEFLVTPPGLATIPGAALSPDGKWLAFTSASPGRTVIFLRSVDSAQLQELEGTDGAGNLFWSPDSRYLGFFARGGLSKVALSGAPPEQIATLSGNNWGGTWNEQGVIVFSREGLLYQVAAAAGVPQPLDVDGTAAGTAGLYPSFLSDGRRFLSLSGPGEERGIYVGSLDGGPATRVLDVASRAMAVSGRLLYQREGILLAHEFDEDALRVTGDPVRVADQIAFTTEGGAGFSATGNGLLAYRTGGAANDFQFTWFDRSGKQVGLLGKPAPYRYSFDLSRNGDRVVTSLNGDLWMLETNRDGMTRLTSGPGDDSDVVWSPDGRRIVFSSDRNGHQELFEKDLDTSSEETLLLGGTDGKWAEDWSPDGRYIAHVSVSSIQVLPLFGDRKAFPIVRGSSNEPHVSPDGRWLAYGSPETGRWEVYVVAFPDGDKKRRISTNGGGQPRWRLDGREVFFMAPDGKMMAVDIATGTAIEPGTPRVLFETGVTLDPSHDQYAVSADGQRFLLRMPVAESAPVTVVVNWMNGLTN